QRRGTEGQSPSGRRRRQADRKRDGIRRRAPGPRRARGAPLKPGTHSRPSTRPRSSSFPASSLSVLFVQFRSALRPEGEPPLKSFDLGLEHYSIGIHHFFPGRLVAEVLERILCDAKKPLLELEELLVDLHPLLSVV